MTRPAQQDGMTMWSSEWIATRTMEQLVEAKAIAIENARFTTIYHAKWNKVITQINKAIASRAWMSVRVTA